MTTNPAGALFLQVLRPLSTEPEVFLAHAAGVVRAAGLPATRARITLTHEQLLGHPRPLPAAVRERLCALLARARPSAVIVNNPLFDDLLATIEAALPSARIVVAEEGIPLLSLDQIVQLVRSGRRPLTGRGFDEVTKEFYEAFYEGATQAVYEVEDLTPDVRQHGIEGDLFLDYICYYRKPHPGDEHEALRGATACTFCNVPQIAHRPFAPRFERFVEGLRALLAATPAARVLHVHDAAFCQHADVFAEHVAAARDLPRGLEFCVSQRAPDLVRHRAALERGLERLAAAGHTVHFFLVGFESFSDAELSRFNKGYGAPLNVEVILYLRELRRRFGETVEYARWGSHGFINFTPWTRLEDLRANLFFAFALDFTELCRHFYLRKLRLHPSLPLHRMAEADGLLTETFHDARQEVSHWAAYPREAAWRFRDPRVEAVSRWVSRFFLPTREDEQSVLRPFVEAMQAGWPSWADRQLVLYAAILHAFESGGCTLDDDDARVLSCVHRALTLPWHALFAPPDAARLRTPSPARPGEPAPLDAARAVATPSFRLHVDLVLDGVKPAMLWECPDDPEHARAVARALEAHGLSTTTAKVDRVRLVDGAELGVAGIVVFAARDPAVAERLARAHVAEARRDAGPDVAHEIGELLGYPPCCSRAFAERHLRGEDSGDDLRVVASLVASAGERPLDPSWFELHPEACVEYTPCSLDCAPTAARIAAVRARRARRARAARPARPLLLVTRHDWLELEGFVATLDGGRFTSVSRVGDHPRAIALEERVRGADAFVLKRHALLLFRDGALVDTVGHPELVPLVFGSRSPFRWLDRMAWRGPPRLPPIDFAPLSSGRSANGEAPLTGAIGLRLDRIDPADGGAPEPEPPRAPAPTDRAARWLEALRAIAPIGRPLRSGAILHELQGSGDAVTVRLSLGGGTCVAVIEPADPARPAFARTERTMLWYRLEDGAVFGDALASVLRALLRHADRA